MDESMVLVNGRMLQFMRRYCSSIYIAQFVTNGSTTTHYCQIFSSFRGKKHCYTM